MFRYLLVGDFYCSGWAYSPSWESGGYIGERINQEAEGTRRRAHAAHAPAAQPPNVRLRAPQAPNGWG